MDPMQAKKNDVLDSASRSATPDNLATTSQPQSTPETVVKRPDVKNQVDIIQQKLKSNKVFFYGLPVAVIALVFAVIIFFVLPTAQKYFEYQSTKQTLDENILNMKSSSTNLKTALADEATIDTYDNKLSQSIPVDAKLGSVLDIIQKTADDYGLQKEFTSSSTDGNADRSSITNLAQTNDQKKALFQNLTSGEIEYKPKSITSDASAKLLSIDVSIKGKKTDFLKFIDSMKDQEPVINLAYVEYSETDEVDGVETITATTRFESYTLKLDPADNIKQPTELKIDDSRLLSPIPIETFIWNRQIEQQVQL